MEFRMVSDGAMAMMCCTTWAGVLPDISARGRRALGGIPLLHPYMCKGISLCTIAFTSTLQLWIVSHKVLDHTCKVSCVWQLL